MLCLGHSEHNILLDGWMDGGQTNPHASLQAFSCLSGSWFSGSWQWTGEFLGMHSYDSAMKTLLLKSHPPR